MLELKVRDFKITDYYAQEEKLKRQRLSLRYSKLKQYIKKKEWKKQKGA